MWFTEHGDYLKIYRVIYTISTSDLLRTAEQTLRGAGTSMLPVRRTEILKRTRISSVDSTHVESLANSAMLLSMRNAPSRQPRPSTAEMSLFNAETSDRPMSMPAQPSTSGSLSKTNLWIANQFGRPIYLSSKIFVAQKTTQTISDLRESIQDWYNALEKGKLKQNALFTQH